MSALGQQPSFGSLALDRRLAATSNGMDSSSTLRHRNVPDWIVYSLKRNISVTG